jgi:hypothetical protein
VDDVEELDAGESLVPETLSNTYIIEIVPRNMGISSWDICLKLSHRSMVISTKSKWIFRTQLL